MPNSFATTAQLACPNCGHDFQVQVWLIVDAAEHADLLERATEGNLHDMPCPRCGDVGTIDAPLLIFNPDTHRLKGPEEERLMLVFSPASNTSVAENEQLASLLLGLLAESAIGWQDEWVAHMPIVPRHLLPVLLSNEVHAALADLQTAVVTALESLRQDDPIIYSQVEEAARHHLAGDSVTVYE